MNTIADIRKDYKLKSMSENEMATNPFDQFSIWWQEAVDSNIDEVNAMTLATVNAQGKPSARIVLLKGIKPDGFEFFTNYLSHKANDINENRQVAIVFFWKELERQIRIEGIAEQTSPEVSDKYFNSRPKDSKIGAWASPQSQPIADRNILDEMVNNVEREFETDPIFRPAFWGGYIVRPTNIEFWQGRSNRLHDRIEYFFENNIWNTRRLAP